MNPEAIARFWAKADRSGACWIWNANRLPQGYGLWKLPRALGHRTVLAHRLAYELTFGPIPEGLQIDHLCNTTSCVNPAHMEPVTQTENLRRGRERRTHCGNGHERDEANTYVSPTTGQRACRACQRASKARAAARRKALTERSAA